MDKPVFSKTILQEIRSPLKSSCLHWQEILAHDLDQKDDLELKSLVNAEIQTQTKELSTILRQLAFSSVAICWVLTNVPGNAINYKIWGALGATLIYFLLDLLQYTLTTIGLRATHSLDTHKKEEHLKSVSNRSFVFYYSKIIALLTSYMMIVVVFVQQFWQIKP